jgi:membrane associated rhomboid family serine protease
MSANRSFDIAQKVISGKIDLEMPLWTVIFIGIVAAGYVTVTSLGLSIYDNCKNMTEESKMHDNLRKYLSYTLTIAITIPFTLLFTKMFSKDAAAFIFLYSVMGVVGGAIAINSAKKCEGVEESKRTYLSVALAGFSAALLLSGFMLYPRAKKRLSYD